jgi:hypothetical protein
MREFRSVKLGLKAGEVRALMGQPELAEKDKERYKLGGDDRLTVYYDQGTVRAIQLYFTNPAQAPAWAEVVGDAEVQQHENGSRRARRAVSEENFWVAMYQNKSGTMTTITISR